MVFWHSNNRISRRPISIWIEGDCSIKKNYKHMLFSPSFSFFNFPHVYMIPNLLHGSLPQKPQSSFSLFYAFFLTPLFAMVTLSDPAHISLITLVHNVYVRELVHENGLKGSLNAFFHTAQHTSFHPRAKIWRWKRAE